MPEPETTRAPSGAPRANEQLGAIAAAMPCGVHLFELTADDRLVMIGFNAAAEQVLGVDHSQLEGRFVDEVFADLDYRDAGSELRRIAREGGTWESDEFVIGGSLTAAGVWDLVAFSPRPRQVAVLFRDITDRYRREASLRLAALKYERLRSSMIHGYAFCRVEFDRDGSPVDFVLLDANDYIYPPHRGAELIGKRSRQVWPEIETSPPGLFQACLKAGVSGVPQELECLRASGRWTRFVITCPQDGHFTIVGTDVTDLKCAESAEE